MSTSVVFTLFCLLAYTQAQTFTATINATFFSDPGCTPVNAIVYNLDQCYFAQNGAPNAFVFASAPNQDTEFSLTIYNASNSCAGDANPVLTNAPANACNAYQYPSVGGSTFYVLATLPATSTAAPTSSPTASPTLGPATAAPATQAPTDVPTTGPVTVAPSIAPFTPAPTSAPVTPAPTSAPVTSAPVTSAPVTSAPSAGPSPIPATTGTVAPVTPAPTAAAPTSGPNPTTVPFVIAVNGVTIFNVGGRVPSVQVTGLAQGESLVGVILGLANTQYVVYVIANTGRYFVANPTTGALALSGVLNCTGITEYTTSLSYSFNPVASAFRIISSTGANYRFLPSTGVCFTDGNLFYVNPGNGVPNTPTPAGVGYTNIVSGTTPTSTAEYIIDTNSGTTVWLSRVVVPNNGDTSAPVPVSGVTFGTPIKFTITSINGQNYGVLGIADRLFIVNLDTAQATSVTATIPNVAGSQTNFIVPPANYVFPVAPTAAPTTAASTTSGAGSVVASFAAAAVMLVAALF